MIKSLIILALLLAISEMTAKFSQMGREAEGFSRFYLSKAFESEEDLTIETTLNTSLPKDTIYVRTLDDIRSEGLFLENNKVKNIYHPNSNNKAVRSDQIKPDLSLFVVGESAAFGFPFDLPETFSFKAEFLLRSKIKDFSVYNAALPGIQTLKSLDLSRKILQNFMPKHLVLYAGNNLFISWLPPVDSKNSLRYHTLAFLSRSSFFSILFKEYLAYANQQNLIAIQKTNYLNLGASLDYAFDSVSYNWPAIKKKYLDQFEISLNENIAAAKKQKVNLILMTVPINYKVTPGLKVRQPLTFNPEEADEIRKVLFRVESLHGQHKYAETLADLESVIRKTPLTPIAYYLKAVALERLGKIHESRENYKHSREHTVGNLGSLISINRIIRQVAQQNEIALVDLEKIFDTYYDNKNVAYNEDLLIDDCHPSRQGHNLIADLLASLVAKSK